MSVRIQLDRPQVLFTNLDFLTGKVIVQLVADAALSAVTVKLEGESRTRLSGPKLTYNNERSDKRRTELEWHKLLYKVETLFPTRDVQQQTGNATSSYMLLAGHYEYPFRFKFPFNNNCQNNSMMRGLGVGSMGIAFNPDLNVKHVKKTLPPSLSGFSREAEIRYYVKATVVRPKFYQENIRSQLDIKFLPIEPPRPPHLLEETFARRTQQFAKTFPASEKAALFQSSEPPIFQVDARLPNPSILTCNERLPLRILVQKLSESTETVFLSMLHIELIGYTHVRAHDLTRSESQSWVIMSQSNMNIPLGEPSDPVGKEWKVPSRYWENKPLPNTVCPSFDTCNISRTYQLEVRVGLSHGGGSDSLKPELIVLPLRLAVKVYSGIAPPAALLQRIATPHSKSPRTQFAATPLATPASNQLSPSSFYPPTPITPSYAQHQPPAPPGNTASYFPPPRPSQLPDGVDDDEAPPSYEDAMADEIAPVDGPRREYSIPIPPDRSDSGFSSDLKGGGGAHSGSGIGGLGRRVSERLFPQNGATASIRRANGSGNGNRNGIRSSSRQSSSDDEEFGAGAATAADGHTAAAGQGAHPPAQTSPQARVARGPTLPPSLEESTNGNEGGGR
ncbi:hypothetical protein EPUS_02890 [Endocarpon pusillum Z07020]|uniref:Arrestin-like N-terminal domain-containing protein n=1 Tax=Endocarpon pusillum (strain Z07020 / HMAS-L-300199) TaxID=1263415 RepID=U1HSE6_ENDPU|nr:uncharacterized protein EPUS_02890 [Endocarpon pusillum Z07020]ERF72099.1 hypothetical protein EPUS_02890 [Endocarpon pusillum Z07020]